MDRDLAYWLVLARQPYVGTRSIQSLLALNTDLSHFFKKSELTAQAQSYLDPRALKTPLDWKGVEKDLSWLSASPFHHIIKITSCLYPALLRAIPQAPALLFIKGHPQTLSYPQIGIVGSRSPTTLGYQNALSFGQALAQKGLVITSGLARGIDLASHQGALRAGGITIAVLGHGLDEVYPKSHTALAQHIVQKGALVSEFPIGVGIKPEFFPRRNRLISGLSYGILVIEAALKSGSLITARYALEQGRDVFAIPGSIHNPLAKGCHHLIRQGAKCVETAEHVIEDIQAFEEKPYEFKKDIRFGG